MPDARLISLQDLLCNAFDTAELEDLSFRLDVDYEELAGNNKTAKIRALIQYLDRRKRLEELIQTGLALRPELEWPDSKISIKAIPSSASTRSLTTSEPIINVPPVSHVSTLNDPKIYISYARGAPWEGIVDELDKHFQSMGVDIIRDLRNLSYKGRIKEFMAEIGRGRYVIVVISEKYLKSENCMFELLEIARNGSLYQRIFPIVLEDAKIYKAIDRIEYIKYWEKRIAELDNAMKQVGSADLQGIRDDIDLYTCIRAMIAGLTDTIKDMLTLTPETHQNTHFEILYQAIETAIEQDSK